MALGEEILLTECIRLDVVLFWLCRIMPCYCSFLAAGCTWLLWICGLTSTWLSCCMTSYWMDGMTGHAEVSCNVLGYCIDRMLSMRV